MSKIKSIDYMESLNILISNDDGVFAEGIRALARSAFKKVSTVPLKWLKFMSWSIHKTSTWLKTGEWVASTASLL